MSRRSRRGRHHGQADTSHQRQVNYRNLKNSLIRQPAFSEDRLEAIHDTALRVIEELGEPVEVGLQGFNTNIRFNDGERVIEADRSLSGPDGEGLLHVVARSSGDEWEISVLELDVDGSGIDLLDESPEPPDL